MIRKLVSWWRRRLRALDRQLLWPACLAQTATREQAEQVFLVHAEMDPAWYREMSRDDALAEIRSWT